MRKPVTIKYIRYDRPGVSGIYYFDGNVYYRNVSAVGNLIVLIPAQKGEKR